MEIPIKQLEEVGKDMREEYYIPCTYPHPRMKHQDFHTKNYIKCNSLRYHVKWNPRQQEAKVFCTQCAGELFSHQLNMSPQIGGNNNGTTDDTHNNSDSSHIISNSNGSDANISSEETHKDA